MYTKIKLWDHIVGFTSCIFFLKPQHFWCEWALPPHAAFIRKERPYSLFLISPCPHVWILLFFTLVEGSQLPLYKRYFAYFVWGTFPQRCQKCHGFPGARSKTLYHYFPPPSLLSARCLPSLTMRIMTSSQNGSGHEGSGDGERELFSSDQGKWCSGGMLLCGRNGG